MAIKVRKTRGKVLPSAPVPPPPASTPLISDAKLKQLYSRMLQCRMLGQRADRLRTSPVKPARHRVQEAAAVGVAIDLRGEDWVAPLESDVLIPFLKGMPLASIIRELHLERGPRKTATDLTPGAESDLSSLRIIPPAANPSAQLNRASGVALALQTNNRNNVVVAFCGDISDSGPRWQEALAFAGQHCLPLLIVMKVHASAKASAKLGSSWISLVSSGKASEVPVIPVDADDVVAFYRVACESIHKARHGGGPTLIQAVSLPATAGSKGADTHASRHSAAIAKMEDYLSAKGMFSPSWKHELMYDFIKEADSAFEAKMKTRPRARK